MGKILILIGLLLLAGCSSRPRLPDLQNIENFGEIDARTSTDDLSDQIAKHKGIVAGLEAQLESQRDTHQENLYIARKNHLTTMAWAIAGLAILGAIGCIVLGLWLGKRMWFSFAVSLAGMAVVSLGFAALVPYLPIVGGVVVTGIIGVALWQVWKLKKSDEKTSVIAAEAVRFGIEVAKVEPEHVEELKSKAIEIQKSLGIHTHMRSMVKNIKAENAPSVDSQ